MDPIRSAQDVIRCDVCETAIVQKYCDFCHVNLCIPCIGKHISDDYDKHKVVPYREKKSTLIYPKCSVHQTRNSEFHCETCTTSVCSLCAISDTHRGHIVSSLSDLFYSKRKVIGKDALELENSISPTYAEIANEIETQIANLDGKYGNLTTTLIKCGEEWHREVDVIVEKLRIEIENGKTKHESILKEHLNKIKQIQSLIEQTLLNLRQIEDSNDVSLTMEYISRTKKLSKLPAKIQISLPTFSLKTIDKEQFYKLFGYLTPVSVTTAENGYEVKKPKISTKGMLESPTWDTENMPSTDKLVVAAIDVGSIYSGIAFSYKHDYENDPLKIRSNNWASDFGGLVTLKTPTCVLFNKDKGFHSFGYEAEDKYSELRVDGEQYEWYYFRRFSVPLINRWAPFLNTLIMKSMDGKEMMALDVFSAVIKFFRGHLLHSLEQEGTRIHETDIGWVLTVSAICDNSARQFMREAAVRAGIAGDQLLIALEPEVASLYCKHLPVDKLQHEVGVQGFEAFSKGSKYLVLDCGGLNVDITVYKVQPDLSLKELYRASRGALGGKQVDEAFKQMLIKILGAPVIDLFADSFTTDYVDIFREFETKKRVITSETKVEVTLKIPISLVFTFQENTGENITKTIENSTYSGKIKWVGNRCSITADVMKSFFKVAVDPIVNHVRDILKKPDISDTNNIIMVGGFSESPILQDMIKQSFPDVRVIIPPEPGLAVLKGAVLFGHNPVTISSRITKYS
ncbi:heat shock 70 kDa protein 12A-like [Saccostrea cucullata]|uniref:heat shock 70 kDa protein 12A-like n=1 Tax=Saccostrea cuccullata TaxID=36930 RepID=UPI002ED44F30